MSVDHDERTHNNDVGVKVLGRDFFLDSFSLCLHSLILELSRYTHLLSDWKIPFTGLSRKALRNAKYRDMQHSILRTILPSSSRAIDDKVNI